jgi:lipoate-protein ligase A
MFTHRRPSIVMGRQNDPSVDINYDYCRAEGITVKRVPTPGTVFGHPGYIMNALYIQRDRVPDAIPDVFALLNTKIASAFSDKLGLNARHRPLNDLEVEIEGAWKKIGPFGISFFGPCICCRMGLTIQPMPYATVEKASPGPPEKFADKKAKSVSARVGSLNQAVGKEVPVQEVRALVRDALGELFGVEFDRGQLNEVEERYDTELKEQYDNDAWFWANSVSRRFPQIPDWADLREHIEKIPNGPLIRARVLRTGDTILDVSLTGWYHGVRPLDALEQVEAALHNLVPAEQTIIDRVATAFQDRDLEIGHCSPPDLGKIIWSAANKPPLRG